MSDRRPEPLYSSSYIVQTAGEISVFTPSSFSVEEWSCVCFALCDCPDIGGGRLMWPDQGDAANNLDVAFNWQSSFAPRCRVELPRSARGGGGGGIISGHYELYSGD